MESSSGYGFVTPMATQLAKIAKRMKISKGLENGVKVLARINLQPQTKTFYLLYMFATTEELSVQQMCKDVAQKKTLKKNNIKNVCVKNVNTYIGHC